MLPIVDREREFKFIDANKSDYTTLFMSCFFLLIFIILYFRYESKREKSSVEMSYFVH